jgi:outer membrane receptor protein involved in Fe transport
MVWTQPVLAEPARSYDIAAQDMGSALAAFAAVSGREVLAPSEVIAGKRANAVRGVLPPEEALSRLLAATGLRYEVVEGAFVIKALAADQRPTATAASADIVVTGSRIRGAALASPRIVLRADALRNEGLATLTDVARTIPQNFGGGQNPTVGINVPATSGVNVGSGSSLNLRGLGSDATLTLLNGRRLAYSASRQSVDLSAIPIGIVDRIEVVPDGSSAIYGSDAVAGVVNIILRRDMEGLETSVRMGGATDGGDDERTYSATTGARWDGGGGIVAYEHGFNSPIVGYQRSYTRMSAARGLDLLPRIERHNVAASLHQELGDLTASVDVLYNSRDSLMIYAANAAGDRRGLRAQLSTSNESILLAPSLAMRLGGAWQAVISGSYGRDTGRYASYVFNGDTLVSPVDGCYCNTFRSFELSADGSLFDLPGGAARLALGAGFRDVGFESFRGANSLQNIAAHQRSTYAFGEASLPLLSRGNGAALLQASAALRYERYPDLGDVATPKLGMVLSPTRDLDLKATWGRSFRAPTLLQRYESSSAILAGAAAFGGSGLPPGSTALLITGGRADLKPEKAASWSVTADVHPHVLEGARLELSYFNTHYSDRIVAPIAFTSQALSNPIYANQIVQAPTTGAVARAIAGATQFFNVSGGVYNPARVVAIIDNASVNAARQRLHGVDAAFTLQRRLGSGSDRLNVALYASYLVSSQKLTAAQPEVPLAGRLFNPPHLRTRAVLGWTNGLLGVTGAVNRVGSVTDARRSVAVDVRGMTTVDVTARLRSLATKGPTKGIDVTLSVRNLLNAKPDRIATTLVYDNPYDSTNYSPIGRFIAISVSKTW